jgi:hypothetical protein
MSGLNHSVGVIRSNAWCGLNFVESVQFIFDHKLCISNKCLQSRVINTILSQMAHLLTAITLWIARCLFFIKFVLVFIYFLALVFLKLTSQRLFYSLATTPPHFTTKVWLVSPARPIKVLIFRVVFSTFPTLLKVQIWGGKCSLFLKFDVPLFEIFKHNQLSFRFLYSSSQSFNLITLRLNILVQFLEILYMLLDHNRPSNVHILNYLEQVPIVWKSCITIRNQVSVACLHTNTLLLHL